MLPLCLYGSCSLCTHHFLCRDSEKQNLLVDSWFLHESFQTFVSESDQKTESSIMVNCSLNQFPLPPEIHWLCCWCDSRHHFLGHFWFTIWNLKNKNFYQIWARLIVTDWTGDILHFYYKAHEKNNTECTLLTSIVSESKPDISSSSVPWSSTVVQKLLKTCRWATLLHWMTCSFITMNTNTIVYFDSIPHKPQQKEPVGLELRATDRVGKSDSIERCTNMWFGLFFSWDLLKIK